MSNKGNWFTVEIVKTVDGIFLEGTTAFAKMEEHENLRFDPTTGQEVFSVERYAVIYNGEMYGTAMSVEEAADSLRALRDDRHKVIYLGSVDNAKISNRYSKYRGG